MSTSSSTPVDNESQESPPQLNKVDASHILRDR